MKLTQRLLWACVIGMAGMLPTMARADEVKKSLFVFGIHTAGIEGIASEFRGKPLADHPGAVALIKRNLTWSIDLADTMKFGAEELKSIQANVDRLTFAEIADRMTKLRIAYQAQFAKTIDPTAAGPFILGIQHSGAERIALEASGNARDNRPGSVQLIERNLNWMKDTAKSVGVSTDFLLQIQRDFSAGASFDRTAADLAKLRLQWQAEFLGMGASQGVSRPPCNWMDVGPEALQKDNPGSVTAGPLLTPGSYTIWVAVKQNDPIVPYSLWFPTGPFEVRAGKKYLVRVEDGSPPLVGWTEEHARLAPYRNPGSQGAVYFNNATASNKWYGIAVCLGGGGPGAGVKIAMSGFRFGIALDNGKRLTYSPNGNSNSTVVKIDGKITEFGHPSGKVVEPFAPLPNGGARSTWIMNSVRFTQMLEPVTSQTGKRDTVLVRWLIRNEDSKPHPVGLRLQLDTMIGQNDGVPFTVPGMPGLVTTTADFPKQGPIPQFIQALEVANLKNPGTVAHLSLHLGGSIEAPGRVCLTHWPGFSFTAWEVPLRDLTGDSAVVLYWPEAMLDAGREREIGFSYGLGDVKSVEGRLATTTVNNAIAGRSFPFTVYVQDPIKGETLTLEVPAGIEIEGARTVEVPPFPPGSKERTRIVTWMTKSVAAGNFEFVVRSSTGEIEKQTVSVAIGAVVVPAKTPVQQLIKQLADPNETARLKAAKELGKLGAQARDAIPALERALNDPDEDVRLVAARSLKLIRASSGPNEQVQKLIQQLQSPDEIVRLKAAKDLGKLGPAAVDAIPALQKLLQDPDEDVRRVAANSIRMIQAGAGPSEALQKLIQQLGSPDELVRLKAAKDLAKMGPAAKDALPALQKLLQDPDEDVRRVAANAIDRIRGGPITDPGATVNVAGTIWEGSETLPGFGKLKFQFEPDGKAYMFDAKSKVTGSWTQTGNQVKVTFKDCVYEGTINGDVLAGNARFFDGATWTFSVTRAADPAPMPQQAIERRFAVREPKAGADAKSQKARVGTLERRGVDSPNPGGRRDERHGAWR